MPRGIEYDFPPVAVTAERYGSAQKIKNLINIFCLVNINGVRLGFFKVCLKIIVKIWDGGATGAGVQSAVVQCDTFIRFKTQPKRIFYALPAF
jgi:hypothetical protein